MAPRPRCPRCDVPLSPDEELDGKCFCCGHRFQPMYPPSDEAPVACPRCDELRKLLADVFAAVVYENAGNLDNPFAYIWTKNFKTLKQRWEEMK